MKCEVKVYDTFRMSPACNQMNLEALHDHESDCIIKNVELERHGHECGLF